MATRMTAASRNTAESAVLVPGTTYYLSLHTATPGTTGTGEIVGGSYVRKAIVFGTPVNGLAKNNAAITFTGMPHKTVKYVGVWTAATGGTYKWGGALGTARTVPATATLHFAGTSVTSDVTG